MKTVEILEDFTGYPNGKDRRTFVKDEKPDPVLSEAYADLLIEKGHAREVKPAKAEKLSRPKRAKAESQEEAPAQDPVPEDDTAADGPAAPEEEEDPK